jgi:hypothetical protein
MKIRYMIRRLNYNEPNIKPIPKLISTSSVTPSREKCRAAIQKLLVASRSFEASCLQGVL